MLCFGPVGLAMQEMYSVQVIILEVLLVFLPLKARWDVLQDACWDPLTEHAVQVVIGVFCTRREGLQELEAEGWPAVT